MARRPSNINYAADDKPPLGATLVLAFQHLFLVFSTLALPVVLVSEIGGSFTEISHIVAMTLIACGIGTILQAMRFKGIGSGFLCPNLCGPNFFSSCMQAAWLGGIPLMRGMIITAGVFETFFARLVNRLKFLFPPEISGLVVLMVAIQLVPLGTSKFLGINFDGEPINISKMLVASLTLMTMIGVSFWGPGKVKPYSVLFGLFTGYLVSTVAGQITRSSLNNFHEASWMALPPLKNFLVISFDWSLLPAFIIVSITGALKSFGNLIMCEKVNDADWSEPDMKRVADGLTADSVAVTISGLLGGMATDTSASNVSLSSASGATSRYIGIALGAILILLGFFPKFAALLSIMPMPVMGAIIIFVTCYMIISGMQIILGAGMDQKKTFVIGIALIFGLSLDVMPSMYASAPQYLHPLLNSSLTLSTVIAVILNQLFASGKSKETR